MILPDCVHAVRGRETAPWPIGSHGDGRLVLRSLRLPLSCLPVVYAQSGSSCENCGGPAWAKPGSKVLRTRLRSVPVSGSVPSHFLSALSRGPETELIGIMASVLNLRTASSSYLPVFFSDRKPFRLSASGTLRQRHSCSASGRVGIGTASQQVDEALSVVNKQWVPACLLRILAPMPCHAMLCRHAIWVRSGPCQRLWSATRRFTSA